MKMTLEDLLEEREQAGEGWVAACQELREAYLRLAALDKAVSSAAAVGVATMPRTFNELLELPLHHEFALPAWVSQAPEIQRRTELLIS